MLVGERRRARNLRFDNLTHDCAAARPPGDVQSGERSAHSLSENFITKRNRLRFGGGLGCEGGLFPLSRAVLPPLGWSVPVCGYIFKNWEKRKTEPRRTKVPRTAKAKSKYQPAAERRPRPRDLGAVAHAVVQKSPYTSPPRRTGPPPTPVAPRCSRSPVRRHVRRYTDGIPAAVRGSGCYYGIVIRSIVRAET